MSSAWGSWAGKAFEQMTARPEGARAGQAPAPAPADAPTLVHGAPAALAVRQAAPTAEHVAVAAEQAAGGPQAAPAPLPYPAGAWAPTTVVSPADAPGMTPVRGRRPVKRAAPARTIAMAVAAAAAVVGALMLAQPTLTGANAASTSPSSTAATAATPTTQAAGSAAAGSAVATRRQAAKPAAPGGDVQAVEQGFAQLPREADGDSKVMYAVLLRNPRSTEVAVDVRAIVTLTGRGNRALKVKDERLDSLLPGQTGAIADDTELAGVTGMRVRVLVGSWAPAQGLAGRITAGDVRTRRVAGELVTTATLRSTLAADVGDAEAVAVYHDRAGRIIGGHTEDLDFIPAGGTARVAIDTSHAPRGVARTEVYANPELFQVDD
ncbi:MAG TPA: hypothetical protein VKG45_10140 [Actinomycetes bacterium]|nr:hypothetical protein [Actinomycetes bacterium]